MTTNTTTTTDDKQDILVLGAGLAGLAAAAEAASRGARVTVLEKLGPMSGHRREEIYESGEPFNDTSRAGGGGLNRFALREPVDQILKRHVERGWERVDAELIRTYLERVDKDCRWLRDDLKLPFDGERVKGRGSALCPFFYKICEQRGVRLLFHHKALKLLVEGATVTGVRIRRDKQDIDFRAKAVIIATGSFQGNEEMMTKYVGPEITYLKLYTGSRYNTGDGILMAQEIGAQLLNLTVCHIRTTDKFFGEGPSRFMTHIYPEGIYLNQNCQRFIDEGVADSDTIANAIVYQPGSNAALVFDEKARAKYPSEYDNYTHREEVIQVARDLDELAVKIEVSAAGLKKAVAEFNAAVKDGKATGLTIPKAANAVRIDTPPYYAVYPVFPGLNHPLGGLKVDTRARVLDMENDPIPGLYAAGSIVNWAFGRPYQVGSVTTFQGNYHAGASAGLAMALVFGRIAGETASRH